MKFLVFFRLGNYLFYFGNIKYLAETSYKMLTEKEK